VTRRGPLPGFEPLGDGTYQPQLRCELRSRSDKQWESVSKWLASLPATPANDSLRMMFDLALATGMRAVELANARASWLRQDVDEEGEPAWKLVVVGKGGKEREVRPTSRIAWQLAGHLDRKGFGRYLVALDPRTPLLSALKEPMSPMNATRVYELMKAALVACAEDFERHAPQGARRIRQASPHWMRQAHGRKFVEAIGGAAAEPRARLGR
jgi:integrase